MIDRIYVYCVTIRSKNSVDPYIKQLNGVVNLKTIFPSRRKAIKLARIEVDSVFQDEKELHPGLILVDFKIINYVRSKDYGLSDAITGDLDDLDVLRERYRPYIENKGLMAYRNRAR